MNPQISHDFNDESIEAKVRWFSSLSMEERMTLLCEFTDLALSLNPNIGDFDHAEQTGRHILVLERK